MKITNEAVHQIYEHSKKYYLGELTKKEVEAVVRKKGVISVGSAGNFLQIFKCMMKGVTYRRAMNLYATEYFIRQIHDDFGQAAAQTALAAANSHLIYYRSLKLGSQVGTAKLLEDLAQELNLGTDEASWYPDELFPDQVHKEGAKKVITVNAYERSTKARKLCIQKYGFDCSVCGFNFEKTYGDLGAEFIHVHHLVELAEIGEEYEVDPVKDLRPVCPNCHAMLHRIRPAITIEKLRILLNNPIN